MSYAGEHEAAAAVESGRSTRPMPNAADKFMCMGTAKSDLPRLFASAEAEAVHVVKDSEYAASIVGQPGHVAMGSYDEATSHAQTTSQLSSGCPRGGE